MDSPEIMIAFAMVMLVIALLAVAVDWFGKPLRHRRFRPKIYRFPDERQPRRSQVRETEWSDTAFVLPVVDEPVPDMLVRYPDPRQLTDIDATRAIGPYQPTEPTTADALADPGTVGAHDAVASAGPPTAQVPLVELESQPSATPLLGFDPDRDPLPHLVTLEDSLGPDADGLLDPHEPATEAPASDANHALVSDGAGYEPATDSESSAVLAPNDARAQGWKPGDYVFNFTQLGAEPSPDTVRSRYWKNVAATRGTAMFGRGNTDRMAGGKPPQRRNPRTGKVEIMRLPKVSYSDDDGETPVPEWPALGVDPFASPASG